MVFRSPPMCRSGVHPGLRTLMRPSLVELGNCARRSLKAQAISTSNPASPASRAAATRSGRLTGAELRADEHARAALGVAFHEGALGRRPICRASRAGWFKGDPVLLVRLLHASGFQVFPG